MGCGHVTARDCPQSVVPLFVWMLPLRRKRALVKVTMWRRCYVAPRLLTIEHCLLLTNGLCPLTTFDDPWWPQSRVVSDSPPLFRDVQPTSIWEIGRSPRSLPANTPAPAAAPNFSQRFGLPPFLTWFLERKSEPEGAGEAGDDNTANKLIPPQWDNLSRSNRRYILRLGPLGAASPRLRVPFSFAVVV